MTASTAASMSSGLAVSGNLGTGSSSSSDSSSSHVADWRCRHAVCQALMVASSTLLAGSNVSGNPASYGAVCMVTMVFLATTSYSPPWIHWALSCHSTIEALTPNPYPTCPKSDVKARDRQPTTHLGDQFMRV